MPAHRPAFRHQRTFTIVEILVVLVILGLILGLVGPALLGKSDDARRQTAKQQILLYRQCVKNYYLDTSQYPGSLQDLVVNPGLAQWKGPYVDDAVLKSDPWGQPYHYETPGRDGRDYEIYSLGRDAAAGGSGVDADIYFNSET